jgi:hypothetical protein
MFVRPFDELQRIKDNNIDNTVEAAYYDHFGTRAFW